MKTLRFFLFLGAAGVTLLSAFPQIENLSVEEAVLNGDYTIVAHATVQNFGGPGLCRMHVEFKYADNTYTREATLFLGPHERRSLRFTFTEPHFWEGLFGGVEKTLLGNPEALLKAALAALLLTRRDCLFAASGGAAEPSLFWQQWLLFS